MSFTLPNTTAYVGMVYYQQVLALETSASGGLTAVTSTNALQSTAGIF